MRWWFKEHDEMPEPPTRGIQSAFVLWQQEKVITLLLIKIIIPVCDKMPIL